MSEWTVGAVLDAIADVIPDRLMTVCGDRRSTFAESASRTSRLANYLSGQGFRGPRRTRDARSTGSAARTASRSSCTTTCTPTW